MASGRPSGHRHRHVFSTLDNRTRGEPLSDRSIRNLVGAYLEALRLKEPGISCHSLRHSFATRPLAGGAKLESIQDTLYADNQNQRGGRTMKTFKMTLVELESILEERIQARKRLVVALAAMLKEEILENARLVEDFVCYECFGAAKITPLIKVWDENLGKHIVVCSKDREHEGNIRKASAEYPFKQ